MSEYGSEQISVFCRIAHVLATFLSSRNSIYSFSIRPTLSARYLPSAIAIQMFIKFSWLHRAWDVSKSLLKIYISFDLLSFALRTKIGKITFFYLSALNDAWKGLLHVRRSIIKFDCEHEHDRESIGGTFVESQFRVSLRSPISDDDCGLKSLCSSKLTELDCASHN